jgi:hypothetical protein
MTVQEQIRWRNNIAKRRASCSKYIPNAVAVPKKEQEDDAIFTRIQEVLDKEFPEGLYVPDWAGYPRLEDIKSVKKLLDQLVNYHSYVRGTTVLPRSEKQYGALYSARSMGDLYALCKYYIPGTTFKEVALCLWENSEQSPHPRKDWARWYCKDINKIVFQEGKNGAYAGYTGYELFMTEWDTLVGRNLYHYLTKVTTK